MSGIEARLAEVLAEHRMLGRSFGKVDACGCGWLAPWSDSHPAYRAHLAAALAVVVAAARAEAVELVLVRVIEGLDEYAAAMVTTEAATPEHVSGIEDARTLVYDLAAKVTDNLARAAASPSSIGSGVGGQGGEGL